MFEQEKFIDRLTEQMTLNQLDAKTLAQAINVSHSTVCNLRKGRYQKPSTKVFFSLIEFFNCSADYMLGLVDFPPDGVIYHPPLCKYNSRIQELLKKNSLTQEAFIEKMEISSNLAYKWLYNGTLPSVEYLIKLANCFDMTVDVFIKRVY